MKRKFVLLSLIFASFMLAGCSEKSIECNSISAEAVTDQDDLPIDISKIEQIFIDEYKNRDGNLQSVQQIVDRLADYGFIAIDSDNKVDMANAENMRQFIAAWESGEHAESLVFQVFNIGGLNLLEIVADEGNVSVEQTYYVFQDNRLTQTAHSEFQADYCEYSDEGYLLIEGSWHSPEMYVLTMSEEEEHIALRVEPLDEQCRSLCKKYIAPVSYELNNMFITNWSQDNFGNLDFYDIFECFYMETYGKGCPYTMNDNLSIGNEYEIPAEEFENVILQHFKVSLKELHTLLWFDADKNAYIYRPRGFGEFDYAEVPYPEVTAYEENRDGSLTFTVNAVYPNGNTSKLFSHRVTVADIDGHKYYLANELLGDEEPDLWWHADRLTDDEWDDYHKEREDEDEYSWLIPQADHENFTAEEKKQIEDDTLLAATEVWEFYKNATIDESLPSYSSGIVDFTKGQRIEVLEALGKLGLIVATEDDNTQNGELIKPFYDDYLNGKTGMTTIYKIYEDGTIASITFLYRNEEIQSYYVGVRPDADGVWPDYNSDYAVTSVIVVKPFDDGTFRIISNDVTEQELKLPPVAYS